MDKKESLVPCIDNLSKVSNAPAINIEFQNLTYEVANRNLGRKSILNAISGRYNAGQLTAILGASGAGKSTLLNILAGYVSVGVEGSIKVNGKQRDLRTFRKISTYIMQENLLQPFITVYESMAVAANLKLGNLVGKMEKHDIIMEILTMLRLQKCLNTLTQYLSGGQKKRLSIALELVNNPPVVFLDEPTTGLDNVAVKQCMELLWTLSRQGRNVICTIHTPADSIFQLFDQVYFLADGYCTYNGTPKEIVSYLSSVGYTCPPTYNPADYFLELMHAENGNTEILSRSCRNGKVLKKEKSEIIRASEPSDKQRSEIAKHDLEFPSSFWTQFTVLLGRMFLQMKRNRTTLIMQTIHHIFSAAVLGTIFFGIGNDARMIRSNFNFCLASMVFYIYTYAMVPVLHFPAERKLLKREYFNQWYELKPYFLALSLSTLPAIITLGFVSNVIMYVASNQPLEFDKFMMYTAMMLMLGIASQSLGYIFAIMFNVTHGITVGPSVVACMMVICIHGIGYGETLSEWTKTLLYSSYLRFGLVGTVNAIYENRENLECTDIFCPYSDPKIFLKHMGMADTSFYAQLLGLIVFTLAFKIAGFVILKMKLATDFKVRFLSLVGKMSYKS